MRKKQTKKNSNVEHQEPHTAKMHPIILYSASPSPASRIKFITYIQTKLFLIIRGSCIGKEENVEGQKHQWQSATATQKYWFNCKFISHACGNQTALFR